MDYLKPLKYHYKTKSGWVNDPNGLVYFNGCYHIFYQHHPNYEIPTVEKAYWGHARTRDFITYEELPLALCPETEYDVEGCWSGTAIVKDGTLYLFYASITKDKDQTVSIAYSKDGVNFTKYKGNPVITHFPEDGSRDFRDPAVCEIDGKYYCVMASGKRTKARLLLYRSENMLDWEYEGIMCEWDNTGVIGGKQVNYSIAECPSIMQKDGKVLLTASVQRYNTDGTVDSNFAIMYGTFKDGKYTIENSAEVDKGPDQYAGQVFKDHKGRCMLISWIPGWNYKGYAEKDVGCMSVPREIKIENGRITAYPVAEVQHLLTDSDEALERTRDGFIVKRANREPLIYNGKIRDLKILRDEFIMEIFVNGGEEVYSVLL